MMVTVILHSNSLHALEDPNGAMICQKRRSRRTRKAFSKNGLTRPMRSSVRGANNLEAARQPIRKRACLGHRRALSATSRSGDNCECTRLSSITRAADVHPCCRWRVTEISQIVLILLDSRCPLLHYPPSLESYLSSPHLSKKRTILVLTKVDISGAVRAEAWITYFQRRYPHLQIVQVEAYAEKATSSASGSRKMYEPYLPSAFRQTLVDALKETHAELLEPPERIRDVPEKLATWTPPVKREVDWEAVLHARGGKVGTAVGGVAAPRAKEDIVTEAEAGKMKEQDAEDTEDVEPEFLTIGLIGTSSLSFKYVLYVIMNSRSTQCRKVFSTQCTVRHSESQSFQDTGQGALPVSNFRLVLTRMSPLRRSISRPCSGLLKSALSTVQA